MIRYAAFLHFFRIDFSRFFGDLRNYLMFFKLYLALIGLTCYLLLVFRPSLDLV